MALWAEVLARVSTEKLRALTNPDNRGQTSINQTIADLAVADTEADFLIHGEIDYDGTDARHVVVGVRGVIAYLMSYGAAHGDGAANAMTRFREYLQALRNTTSRGRLSPATESRLVPSDEFAGGREVRPDFDREHFGGMIPEKGVDPFEELPVP